MGIEEYTYHDEKIYKMIKKKNCNNSPNVKKLMND